MPKQSKITGALSLIIAQAVVLLLGFVTHFWIGRFLGSGPYGIYGVVLSIQSIIGIFLTLGVPSAISRFVAQDEVHAKSILRQAIKIQTIIGIVLGGGTALLAPLFARILNDQSLTPYIAFVGVVIFLQAFYQVYVQYLSGMHRFNQQAALTTLYAVAKVAGAIGLMYFFLVYGALAGFAVGGVLAAIVGWWWTRSLGGEEEIHLPLKAFLSFAGMYALILFGLQMLMSVDLFMVKALLKDNTQAGYYNAAVTLSRISYLLLQGLAFIILPSVSALTKPGASHDKAALFIKNVLRYLIALIVPSITLAAATSEELIGLFYGKNYLAAAPSLSILMLGLGALAFYLLLSNIVAGAGRAKVALVSTMILVAVSGLLGLIFIPAFGLRGAALQTTITAFGGLLFLGIYTFRTFNVRLPIKSTVNVAIATAVAVLPTYIWEPTPLLLPLQYIVLLLLYVLVLFIIGEISRDDRKLVASIHPSLRWIAK